MAAMTQKDIGQHPAPPVQAETGAIGWWLFFVSYIPIPLVPMVVWIVIAWRTFAKHRGDETPTAVNSRNALNWALTYIAGMIIGVLLIFVASFAVVPLVESGRANSTLGLVIAVPFLLMFVWTAIAWVHAIVGGIKAGKGVVYKAAFTVPFIRS